MLRRPCALLFQARTSFAVTNSKLLSACSPAEVLSVVEDSVGLSHVNVATALRRLAVLHRGGQPSGEVLSDARYLRLERFLCAGDGRLDPRLDTRARASAIWAAGVLQRPALLDALCVRVDARASLDQHAVAVWAIGRLRKGRQHRAMLIDTADLAAALLRQFNPSSLALKVLHSLTRLPEPDTHTRLPLVASDAQRSLSSVNPQTLTRLFTGFAACQHAPPSHLVVLAGREATRQLPLFQASNLAFLLWAHARLGLLPERSLLLSAPVALARMLSMPGVEDGPRAAAVSLWAFSRLRIHPGEAFLQACDETLARAQQVAVSDARLVSVVSACGALGWRLPQAWPRLAEQLSKQALTMRAADAAGLAVGLARLHLSSGAHPADEALWDAIEQRHRVLGASGQPRQEHAAWALAIARGHGKAARCHWLACRDDRRPQLPRAVMG